MKVSRPAPKQPFFWYQKTSDASKCGRKGMFTSTVAGCPHIATQPKSQIGLSSILSNSTQWPSEVGLGVAVEEAARLLLTSVEHSAISTGGLHPM